MKTKWIIIGVLATCLGVYAASIIRWTWHEKPILRIINAGETLELGLRDDGVVVWREVTQTTNSPSEATPPLYINVLCGITNSFLLSPGLGLMVTNTATNILIYPNEYTNAGNNLDVRLNPNSMLWEVR
jgi:hypothetical protein